MKNQKLILKDTSLPDNFQESILIKEIQLTKDKLDFELIDQLINLYTVNTSIYCVRILFII